MAVDDFLLSILVCPVSRAPLVLLEDAGGALLVSTDAGSRLAYPVRDGIPSLLADEAEALDEETWKKMVAEGRRAPAPAETGVSQ